MLELFLVKRVEAEAAAAEAQANAKLATMERELRLLRERDELRGERAKRARDRNKRLPRDSRGHLMSAKTCPLCRDPYATHLTTEMITVHRNHTNGAG